MKGYPASNRAVRQYLDQLWGTSELKRVLRAKELSWDSQEASDSEPFLKALAKAYLMPGADSRSFRFLNVFASGHCPPWLPDRAVEDQPIVWLFLGLSTTLSDSLNERVRGVARKVFPPELSSQESSDRWESVVGLANSWQQEISKALPNATVSLPRNIASSGSWSSFWVSWLKVAAQSTGELPSSEGNTVWSKSLRSPIEARRLCVHAFEGLMEAAVAREIGGQQFNDQFVTATNMAGGLIPGPSLKALWSNELEGVLLDWLQGREPWQASAGQLAVWLLWEHASDECLQANSEMLQAALDRSMAAHLAHFSSEQWAAQIASPEGFMREMLQMCFPQAQARQRALVLDKNWPTPEPSRRPRL